MCEKKKYFGLLETQSLWKNYASCSQNLCGNIIIILLCSFVNFFNQKTKFLLWRGRSLVVCWEVAWWEPPQPRNIILQRRATNVFAYSFDRLWMPLASFVTSARITLPVVVIALKSHILIWVIPFLYRRKNTEIYLSIK